MAEETIVASKTDREDEVLDITLRPRRLDEYVGQGKVKKNLEVFIQAAKGRKEPLEHTLIYGPPGLGKTTLANIIAAELGANIRTTSGPAIEKAGDLASILSNLSEGDVLFIDEIHRLNRIIEEVLYPAMEDFVLDLVIGKGPSARTLRLDLPQFTLVGATTRVGLISSPMRDRFGSVYALDFYSKDEIKDIINRSARILKIGIDDESSIEIAKRSRRTPRVANRLLKRVRDYAQVKNQGKVDGIISKEALDLIGVDEMGLDQTDRRLLETIVEKFAGGPVGIGTIAAATSEDRETIEEVYEPYLIQMGFLERTSKGRRATNLAYEHLNIKPKRLL
jgi:Holliday junction DNA helicase RuvB